MKSRKYTKEVLEPVIKKSFSIADVLREFGVNLVGGNYRHINRLIRHYELDTSHFTGQLWSKGLKKSDHASIKKWADKNEMTDEELFTVNSKCSRAETLRRRFIRKTGRLPKCEEVDCGIETWKGKPLTFHLDHRNGNNSDNRIENLKWLCPNCHQQTWTWGNQKVSALGETRTLTPEDTDT